MKQESKSGNLLSLKKNTVTFLDKGQTSQLKGGQAIGGGTGQSCGYVCGDCASSAQSLIACIPKPSFR